MKFNSQIKDIFVQNNINYDEGMLYLLSIYFNLNIDEKKFEQIWQAIEYCSFRAMHSKYKIPAFCKNCYT